VENFHLFGKGKTRDKVASALGISGKTWDKLSAIQQSEYDDLKADLEQHGKVDRVFKRLQRRQRAQQAALETQGTAFTNITCGDCRDILPTFQENTFHAVVTDPPFGIGFEYDGGRESSADPEDYWKWFGPVYQEILRVTKPGGFICLWQSYQYMHHFQEWYGDWHLFTACKNNVEIRPNSPFTSAVDPMVMVWKPGAKPLLPTKQDRSYNWFATTIQYGDEVHMLHPCPRSLDLCENMIRNFTIENGLILDCFAGVGSIPLAVQRVGGGRQFVAIEKHPQYCQVADRRLTEDSKEIEVAHRPRIDTEGE
jgi:DNA modification methylase